MMREQIFVASLVTLAVVSSVGAVESQKQRVAPHVEVDFESWGDAVPTTKFIDSTLGKYDSAAAVTDGAPCAQVATNIMREGGNAVEAAIAGLICVSVINVHSLGIGGGFLLTYYNRETQTVYTLDSREAAPLAATENMFEGNSELALRGGLAVAIPSQIKGYKVLFERFGSGNIAWGDLFEPSIELCEDGHPMNWHLARALEQNRDIIFEEPSLSIFIDPATGDLYKEGDILRLPQLAETMEVLQEEPDALYTGSLADKLIEDLESFGSIITKEDLKIYEPIWRDNVNTTLMDGKITMYSMPPPSSGVVLAFMLNILDNYNFTPESLSPENTVVTHQRIIESFKYAYAKRTELGDGDFVDIADLMQNLTSKDYAHSIFSKIEDDKTHQDPEYYGAVADQPTSHGTSHFSVLAPNGDAVAVTSTINRYLGAKIRSVQTGIIFNNQMDDFSSPNITNSFGVPPSPNNFIRPKKHPLSSMTPTIFVDEAGDVRMVIGAAGGTKITTAVAQAVLNNLWFGQNIKEAIDERRLHHQLYPMSIDIEDTYDPAVIQGLQKIGHETTTFGIGGSIVCGITREDGYVYANSDFRKAGEEDGF